MLKYRLPLDTELIDELFPFWTSIFGGELPDFGRSVFLGEEEAHNRGTLYLKREGGQLAGTCFLLQSKGAPALAGLGEVATDPRFRGQGIATELCGQALADFHAAGGEALFLGTVNPSAARIYHRLGWRKLAGANVMVNIALGELPEAFLADYFRTLDQVEISVAGPDVRVPMIPLILTPHNGHVLDTNVGLYSCRYRTQNSCMGLYPRYALGLKKNGGEFFAARTPDGKVVGLSTALPQDDGGYRIDGFVHQNFSTAWPALIDAACDWAKSHGASTWHAAISLEDTDKQALFKSMGFVYAGPATECKQNGLAKWETAAPKIE